MILAVKPKSFGELIWVVRKKAFILGVALLVGIAVLLGNSRDGRVAYHKWRLAVAVQQARTAGAGKPTKRQELWALLRGKIADSRECLAAWRHHENALVRLDYLTRREFPVTRRPDTEERVRIADAAEKIFRGPQLWSIAPSVSNEFAVIITAPPRDMPQWERLMAELKEEAQYSSRFGYVRQRQAW